MSKNLYERRKGLCESPLLDWHAAPVGLYQRVRWDTDRSASHSTTDPRPYRTTRRADRDTGTATDGYCCARSTDSYCCATANDRGRGRSPTFEPSRV
jgi:hypothetical protein